MTTLPCPTTIQGVAGSSCDGYSLLSLFLFVCSYYGNRREVQGQGQNMGEEDL
jgi:hypothetical protein